MRKIGTNKRLLQSPTLTAHGRNKHVVQCLIKNQQQQHFLPGKPITITTKIAEIREQVARSCCAQIYTKDLRHKRKKNKEKPNTRELGNNKILKCTVVKREKISQGL